MIFWPKKSARWANGSDGALARTSERTMAHVTRILTGSAFGSEYRLQAALGCKSTFRKEGRVNAVLQTVRSTAFRRLLGPDTARIPSLQKMVPAFEPNRGLA